MRLNAKQIAAYTGGQFLVDPIDASALMTGITWDSREVRPGWLYVALPGERVDGHAFVEAALRAGAAGALVTDGPSQSCALLARELGAAIIEVPNTASAITDLARAWRSHLRGRVIGLTGSVGKTTTKNLTRDACAAYGSVVATKANQNNELGVPRTLLNADPETAVVVVEMGMRGRGQIAELCDFVRPVWGLITNVGESHIELLGSRENIARAKSELFEALPAGVGRAFANLDDDFAAFMAERGRLSERSVALSGFAGHPDAALRGALERESAACDQAVWAEDVSLDAEGRPRFTLCARDAADHDDGALFATVERVPCALSLTGAHNVDNACAAASVGFALGLDLATIAAALGASVPEPGRQEVIAARGGFTVINDAYNASPDSMRASLATFAATDVAGRRIAVLGDMGELGSFAPACHEGVGAAAASHHLDKLICIGELARHIAAGAEAAGMDAARISRADTVADVLEELGRAARAGRRRAREGLALLWALPVSSKDWSTDVLSVLRLPHVHDLPRRGHRHGDHHGAHARLDPLSEDEPHRPAGARRRPPEPSGEAGNPHDGRRSSCSSPSSSSPCSPRWAPLPRSCGLCSAPRWPPVSSGSSMMLRRWPTSDRLGSRPRRS